MTTICKEKDKKKREKAFRSKDKKYTCGKCGAYSNKEKKLCKPKKGKGES